jgi:hypothetical protein
MAQGQPIPYGIRDIKLTPYTTDAATVLAASSVDLPIAQTLGFVETEDSNTLRGDDADQAVHGSGAKVQWTLEAGGLSFEAVRTMYGGVINESGVTPNQVKTLDKNSTHSRPYFQIEGQTISDSGGDVHAIIRRAKSTGDLKGDFKLDEFFITGAEGVGLPSLVPATLTNVWRLVQNETAVAIP